MQRGSLLPSGSRCSAHKLQTRESNLNSDLNSKLAYDRTDFRIGKTPLAARNRLVKSSNKSLHESFGRRDSKAGVVSATIVERETETRSIPQTLKEVHTKNVTGYGAELAADHPGFNDVIYKARRAMLAKLAEAYRDGEPIPSVDYTADEKHCWSQVLRELKQLYPAHACKEFLELFDRYGFKEGEINQLQDVSELIRQNTGFRIHPVAGMLHPRDFLNALAFKVFHSTQYIRHRTQPTYSPEPDGVHDLIGHTVMLSNPAYADLVHTIGVASLAADDKQIWHLIKVYWYTVEYGVVREGEKMKAFGAGILSSYGEMQHMASNKAELIPFDAFAKQPKMSYNEGFQKRYFVLSSFEAGARQLHKYCESITPPEILEKFFGKKDFK